MKNHELYELLDSPGVLPKTVQIKWNRLNELEQHSLSHDTFRGNRRLVTNSKSCCQRQAHIPVKSRYFSGFFMLSVLKAEGWIIFKRPALLTADGTNKL